MLTGGCLCGAVRWSSRISPKAVHYCHCSICRRWSGAPFATLAWFWRAGVNWTGEPALFRSSPIAVRSHCATCGTPLALSYDARDDIVLSVGTFDTPESVVPAYHYGVESRLGWVDIGRGLPSKPTREHWD